MSLVIYTVISNIESHVLQLAIGTTTGIIYYIVISKLTKSQDYNSLVAIIRDKVIKRIIRH